jgi:E3 ubiquitin-protein ligase HERC2
MSKLTKERGLKELVTSFQFSLALSKSGLVWTWGKGDYFRLGHGSDQHVRKPTVVECLRGKKIIHVAVGALHCLAVTESGQVYAWGDNDHGQQVGPIHLLPFFSPVSPSLCQQWWQDLNP